MEGSDNLCLEAGKSSFLSLLSSVDPSEAGSFVDWVVQCCSSFHTSGDTLENIRETFIKTPGENRLRNIIKEIKKRVPLDGILSSEKICHPAGKNSDCDPLTTVHVDSFLYSDEDIDRLCDERKMSRYFCKDCGSHNTSPLTFISHSSSLVQLRFIFEVALPTLLSSLDNKCLVDVGSRLGAVLYGAYHFSGIEKIVGVEVNLDLCKLQQEIIEKYHLSDRVQVRCVDICNELNLLKEADIIVFNNVFEFFLPVDEQIRTWRIIRENLSKSGCVLVTVPSLEEATMLNNEPCVDINEWVMPCSVNCFVPNIPFTDGDTEELQNIFFYQVK